MPPNPRIAAARNSVYGLFPHLRAEGRHLQTCSSSAMASCFIARTLVRAPTAASSSSPTFVRYATTSLRMPAMSPTMTEGGVGNWKFKEGESFSTGDVILEVETDKATMDIEAQDDGVMGKILVKEGTSKVPVGQIIALLAEEGDDLSSIEVPKNLAPEGSSSSSSTEQPKAETKAEPAPAQESKQEPASEPIHHEHKQITHSQPIFPSVARLLQESSLSSSEISKLKGTGKRGMLTKGDVLKALGKIQNAYGSAEQLNKAVMGPSGVRKGETLPSGTSAAAAKPAEKPLDGAAFRRLILQGMSAATAPAQPIIHSTPISGFDSVLADYAALLPPPQPAVAIPEKQQLTEPVAGNDEFAGLY